MFIRHGSHAYSLLSSLPFYINAIAVVDVTGVGGASIAVNATIGMFWEELSFLLVFREGEIQSVIQRSSNRQLRHEMTQALPKPVTVKEFAAWYSVNSERRDELHNGVIVEMPLPIGEHKEVIGFLVEVRG